MNPLEELQKEKKRKRKIKEANKIKNIEEERINDDDFIAEEDDEEDRLKKINYRHIENDDDEDE